MNKNINRRKSIAGEPSETTYSMEFKIPEGICSYESAFEELNIILGEIEDEEVPVDTLSTKVQRASELLSYCRFMLKRTESNVQDILSKLGKTDKHEE